MTPNLEVLRQLRRVVEEAPAERFDMRFIEERTFCGTVHCALGWARIDSWFVEHGLRSFDHARDWGAFFGLSEEQGNVLFAGEINRHYPERCISRAEVIANIDRLLDGKPALPYPAMLKGVGS